MSAQDGAAPGQAATPGEVPFRTWMFEVGRDPGDMRSFYGVGALAEAFQAGAEAAAAAAQPAPGPCPGCESLRRQCSELAGEVGALAGVLTEIRDNDHPYGSYSRVLARNALDCLHGATGGAR